MTTERVEQLRQLDEIEHQPARRFVAGEFLSLVEQARVFGREGERLVHRQRAQGRSAPRPLALKRSHHLPALDAGGKSRRQDDGDFEALAVRPTLELRSGLRLRLARDRADGSEPRGQRRGGVAAARGGLVAQDVVQSHRDGVRADDTTLT